MARKRRVIKGIGKRDVEILVEAVYLGEQIKPSQQAKRDVFKKYGIVGTDKDRLLTREFYWIMRMLGILDNVIKDFTGVENPAILDPYLRAALRVGIYFVIKYPEVNVELLRAVIGSILSNRTHPYTGMYAYKIIGEVYEKRRIVKEKYREELETLLPKWFINKLRVILTDEEIKKLSEMFNSVPLISVRVNTLKGDVESVIRHLEEEHGKEVQRGKLVNTVLKFPGPFSFEGCKLYRKGILVVQEEAAALASLLLDPKPGETVVDMCAAPGGKTSHLAELMRNEGVIYAFDIDHDRIQRMKELLRRCGIKIVKIYERDCREAPDILGRGFADRVLVDVPCTADGTIMKNPELRWRIREESITKIAELQLDILLSAAELVKPGGRMLYCTCSMFTEEDEEVIERFLKKRKDFKIVEIKWPGLSPGFLRGTARCWPHIHNTIGFFYALLERKS